MGRVELMESLKLETKAGSNNWLSFSLCELPRLVDTLWIILEVRFLGPWVRCSPSDLVDSFNTDAGLGGAAMFALTVS